MDRSRTSLGRGQVKHKVTDKPRKLTWSQRRIHRGGHSEHVPPPLSPRKEMLAHFLSGKWRWPWMWVDVAVDVAMYVAMNMGGCGCECGNVCGCGLGCRRGCGQMDVGGCGRGCGHGFDHGCGWMWPWM